MEAKGGRLRAGPLRSAGRGQDYQPFLELEESLFCLHKGAQSLLQINDIHCQVPLDATLSVLKRKAASW